MTGMGRQLSKMATQVQMASKGTISVETPLKSLKNSSVHPILSQLL